jgi:hypothetical protein
MSITFHVSDGLPDTVAVVLVQHSDRTMVLLNYALVELMCPSERLGLINALLAKADDGPPTGRQLDEFDELAAPRRERSRREHRVQTSERTDLGGLGHESEKKSSGLGDSSGTVGLGTPPDHLNLGPIVQAKHCFYAG